MRMVNALIENCLSVLSLLATRAGGLELADIAASIEQDPATARRVLSSLVDFGWVDQDAKGERYRLSLKLPATAYHFMQFVEPEAILQPVLDRIGRLTGELVRLSVLAGDGLSTLAYSQGSKSGLICQTATGAAIAVHTSASGKAWLASLQRDAALALALASGLGHLDSRGSKTIATVDDFVAELELTSERGFGVALDEEEAFVGSVAAAITTDGHVVGTLGILAPTSRLDTGRIAELGRIARDGAGQLAELWQLWQLASSEAVGRLCCRT